MWAATNSDVCLNMCNEHDKTHALSSKCSMPTGLTRGMSLIPTSKYISSTGDLLKITECLSNPHLEKSGQKE